MPSQLVQFRREQRRDGPDLVAREGKPQIFVAQDEALDSLVQMLLVDVGSKGEAGRETIGGIAGVEAIDEPQSFLADRNPAREKPVVTGSILTGQN